MSEYCPDPAFSKAFYLINFFRTTLSPEFKVEESRGLNSHIFYIFFPSSKGELAGVSVSLCPIPKPEYNFFMI